MSSTVNGLKWSAIERLATQAIQLIAMLFLARLLGPSAFGLVGMLAVFIAVSQVFTDSGFTSALIRHSERTESDFSTAFYFNIFIGFFCYLIIFLLAPFIASFFEQPELVNLVRVLALNIVIHSFTIVQRAKLTIAMDFKTQAKTSLLSVVVSCGVALYMAELGFGVWALVSQTLSNAFFSVVLLNLFHPWVPKKGFSNKSFKYLFGFGSKLLAASLIDTIFKNIYQIIIGKHFSATQVGFFTQANQLSLMPAMTMTTVIQRVTYPMLTNIQSDINKFEEIYLLTLRLAALIVFPLMVLLSISAEPFINTFLGAKWLPASELLSILSLAFMLYPIHAINLNLLQVKGRSDIFLKLEIIKKTLITIMLIFTIPFGVKAMCIGLLLHSFIAFFINSFYTGKFSRLNTTKQLSMLLPICGCVMFSGLLTYIFTWYLITNYIVNSVVHLVINLIVMPVIYIGLIYWVENDLYTQILHVVFRKRLN
ncbi:lipopolysaccharide biosynthesis protein [Pseudoalteromonas sp. McH1-7]|uniref:lipopolysaccharide biosynthesis protein n=1 Tax=Pseudoalteromonas sp. McH1-7 TaxID=2745574 RepID=UPI00159263FF|nr:lipopolysaccharide biosynthesis protein [Pseudoalteromonas sp. McH1-7]NUZ10665.1 lipopolysaccharide biosynthesis protein [Pseudoalteromonas sp. McH1-7]